MKCEYVCEKVNAVISQLQKETQNMRRMGKEVKKYKLMAIFDIFVYFEVFRWKPK